MSENSESTLSLETVLAREMEMIASSRQARGDIRTPGAPQPLIGLALSSGGIRSATFCLGVLQGLAASGLLRGVDYLSSVGGGGYIGGWLVAQLGREGFAKTIEHLATGPWRVPPPAPRAEFWAHTIIRHALAVGAIVAGLYLATLQDWTWTGFHLATLLDWWLPGSLLTATGATLLWWSHQERLSLFSVLVRYIALEFLRGDVPLTAAGKVGPYPIFVAALTGGSRYTATPLFHEVRADTYYRTLSFRTLAWAVTTSGPPPDLYPSRLPTILRAALNARENGAIYEPGARFDSLGVYELIERRCQFVIACDATDDPTISFDALAAVIRKCRVDLKVEIDIALGPLSTSGGGALKHYQMGTIRYPSGDRGVLLYLRPTLTGDEPSDVTQFAHTHPAFPHETAAFDESAFESYRTLGQHIIETLAHEVDGSTRWDRFGGDRMLGDIQRQLRPDLTGVEHRRRVESLPLELVEAVASGECVLCAGAGLAAQSGLPTWPGLLEGLLRFAAAQSLIGPELVTELASAISEGDLEAVGDELAHRVSEDVILTYLRTAIPETATASHAHRLLAEMPFLGALNTSLDHLVASAFGTAVTLPTDATALVSALQAKTRFVVNVSGASPLPSSIDLNARQFRLRLSANVQFSQFLTTLFLRYHTLFVGSTVDGIRGFFDALALSKRPERRQFALVAHAGQLDPVKVRYLDRTYNVRIIEYETGFNFKGFLDYVAQLNSAVVSRDAPARSTTRGLTLKSVTLQNIGPFEELHLDLAPAWNVLLGDNGQGKTVVLRAIAAALCGDRADPVAVTRLLRSSAIQGRIQLTVDNRDYVVELARDSEGRVQIVSASLSPIQADGWLVIGFPALRSVPWDNPAGPTSELTKAPNAEDLLPLLRGVPDGRVSDLKQWLVNLDYAGKKDVSDRFFEVLRKLTPGLRLELAEVDKDTMDISVRTDGGVVPLSAVSQGTGSVMCWIGTLIHRMSEAAASADTRVLVLIDEIDAHMHPKWQQLFVDAFREQFRSVQVIATTHSPLLVGSLQRGELWLVQRTPLQSEIYGVARVGAQPDGSTEIVVTGPERAEGEESPEEGSETERVDEPVARTTSEEDDAPRPRERRTYRVPSGVQVRIRDGEIVEEGEALTATNVSATAMQLDIGLEGWRVDQILTLPYFGLESTRDHATRKLVDEFSSLSAQANLSDAGRARLEEVSTQLRVRAPAPHETDAARQAFAVINDFASEKLKHLEPGEREKVLAEVQTQLVESITASRRPM